MFNLIREGDHVTATTFRKVSKETGTGAESERIKIKLTVEVEAIEFDAEGVCVCLSCVCHAWYSPSSPRAW